MSKNQQKQVFNASNQGLAYAQNQGAANNQQLQGAYSGYQSNANALFPGISSGYSDISNSGGYDPSKLADINQGYESFSQTGGLAPSDISAITNQASNAARSTYQTAQSDLQRQIAATGGFGFTGAAMGNLARQGSIAASNAANSAQAQLVPMIQSGKLAGLGGLAGVQQNLTGNKLNALQGQSGLYNTNVAATQNTLSDIIKNFQVTGQLSNDDLKVLANIANTQQNWWEGPIGGAIGGAAQAGLGFLGL